jgi:hypothetical protein
MATRKEDKLIKEIIKRYGETLDLKSSPYLIVEIIRNYGPLIDDGVVAASCLPPGGPPKLFDPTEVMREIKTRFAEIERLSAVLQEHLAHQVKSAK